MRYALSAPEVSTLIPGMKNHAEVDMNIAYCEDAAFPVELKSGLSAHGWIRNYYQCDGLSVCCAHSLRKASDPVLPNFMRCARFHETRSVAVCLLRAAAINRAFIASVEAGVPSLKVPNHLSRGKTPSAP
jgi:hypothetical protein